jgi:hypothetical protein
MEALSPRASTAESSLTLARGYCDTTEALLYSCTARLLLSNPLRKSGKFMHVINKEGSSHQASNDCGRDVK